MAKVKTKVNKPANKNKYNTALGRNTVNSKLTPFKSTIGPNTKNANNAPAVKLPAKDRAKNASTVEQMDTTVPNTSIATTEVTGPCPNPKITSRGVNT